MAKEIPLSQGFVAIVDDDDYEILSAYKWHVSPVYGNDLRYAGRSPKKYTASGKRAPAIVMHRQILGIEDRSVYVDHRNGNGLDNRRDNLRACTPRQNQWNQRPQKGRQFKGVQKLKSVKNPRPGRKNYTANIVINGDRIYIGSYITAEEAARAYDQRAAEAFGEFAYLNFKEGTE